MVRHSIINLRRGRKGADSSHFRSGCARAKFRPSTEVVELLEREAQRGANVRCQMCGKTVVNHGAYLLTDAPWPGGWRGTVGLLDLWAICDECDAGMRDYLPSARGNDELVRRVAAHKSVHMRIGELLKAVGVGNRAPSSLIEVAAGQSGWRQRLRELRYPVIGWKIECRLYKGPGGRRRSDYLLVSYREWPQDPTGAIRRFEQARRMQKGAPPAESTVPSAYENISPLV
jgi:hypothetical protein